MFASLYCSYTVFKAYSIAFFYGGGGGHLKFGHLLAERCANNFSEINFDGQGRVTSFANTEVAIRCIFDE